MTREQKLERALRVFTLTPSIRALLRHEDPAALHQAEHALTEKDDNAVGDVRVRLGRGHSFHIRYDGQSFCESKLHMDFELTGKLRDMGVCPTCGHPDLESAITAATALMRLTPGVPVVVVQGECPEGVRWST